MMNELVPAKDFELPESAKNIFQLNQNEFIDISMEYISTLM